MAATSVTEKGPATRAELEALPPGVKGEIIDGMLYTQPRPRFRHQSVLLAVAANIDGAFGRGGAGGWWILPEPGVTLPGSPEFSPDVAGWRRERMPVPPDGDIDLAPDWVCEVLSPSTRRYDFLVKRSFYARSGVKHLWYVDTEARTVLVSRLVDGAWLEVGTFSQEVGARIVPFDSVELDVTAWWQALPPAQE